MVIPIKGGCPSSRQTVTGKRLSGLVLVRRLSDEQLNLHIRLSNERPNLHIRRLNDERPNLYIRLSSERLIITIDTVRQLHRRIGHVNRLTIIHRRIHHALMLIA